MKVKLTNFEGDLNALCRFCHKPQRSHFIDVGMVAGERYMHHQPCDAQIKSLGIDVSPRAGRMPRLLRQLFTSRAA